MACSLGAGEQADRLGSWEALAAGALLDSSATPRGLRARLRGETEAELRELIAAEAECCAFLDFELDAEGPELRLTIEGPDEARPIIFALLGLDPLAPAALA